jgi:hypothetical protein
MWTEREVREIQMARLALIKKRYEEELEKERLQSAARLKAGGPQLREGTAMTDDELDDDDFSTRDPEQACAMKRRLRELRGESLALMLDNETFFCGDGVCCVCGHRAYEAGLEFFLITPLPAAKRTKSQDDEPRIIDTSQVCHYCAERCDPGLVAALRRMEATPFRDLSDCQSPLWKLDDLPQRLVEFGLGFVGARENRNVARVHVAAETSPAPARSSGKVIKFPANQ